ncbi:hypothetical protein J6590_008718 [Homalodisca vitripennis]|nr:hypothetical protein J6590_008718 [Homalodisca vitripennis]
MVQHGFCPPQVTVHRGFTQLCCRLSAPPLASVSLAVTTCGHCGRVLLQTQLVARFSTSSDLVSSSGHRSLRLLLIISNCPLHEALSSAVVLPAPPLASVLLAVTTCGHCGRVLLPTQLVARFSTNSRLVSSSRSQFTAAVTDYR